MNNRMKKILACCMALALCIGMAAPVYAAQNPFAYMEAQSRQAVEAAIKAGTVPAGTTIYECAYGADKNGNTIVIQYRDKNGNWVDVGTQKTAADKPAATANSGNKLTEEQLAEYTQEVFLLVNKEREAAGLEPLERNSDLDKAATARANECVSQGSIRVDGKSHTRPNGSAWTTILDDMDIEWRGASENASGGRTSPTDVMDAWMTSDGHKATILTQKRSQIGIGVCQASDGTLYWIQIFVKP